MRRPSKCEKDFVRRAVIKEFRLDGRGVFEHRGISVEYGIEEGTVIVSFGETRVLVRTSAQIAKPVTQRPSEGLVNVKMIFSPMALNHFVSGRQMERVKELRRHLEHSIRVAIVDLELLCIIPAKAVWQIDMSFIVLNDDGNVMGCLNFAALASLMTVRLRQTRRLDDDVVEEIPVSDAEPGSIRLKRHAFIITFAVFSNGAIVDPSHAEERFKDGQLIVSISPYNELNATNISGGVTFKFMALRELIDQASICARVLHRILMAAVQHESENRRRDGWLHFSVDNTLSTGPVRSQLPVRKVEQIVMTVEPETKILSDEWMKDTLGFCERIQEVSLDEGDVPDTDFD